MQKGGNNVGMVLKATKKYKELSIVTEKKDSTVTENYRNIKENAADSIIYEIAEQIQAIKNEPCTINIRLHADDFKIVDDTAPNDDDTPKSDTDLDDALEYSKEFTLAPGENKFDPTVKFAGTSVKITDRMVYGPNLDGQNRQVKIYYLGYQGNLLGAPKEVPLNGFDEFAAPNDEGKWQYDSSIPELSFDGGSPSTKVYKIVKTKG
jgi:hypothetical protein